MHDKKHGSGLQRQIGKVMELMLQYEGGVGAFLTGAGTYGIDLDQLAETAWPAVPERVRAEAKKAWDWAEKKDATFGLAPKTYMVCDALKRLWREAHPATASYWPELKLTVLKAINKKGHTFECRKLKVRCDAVWLRIALPSGRSLCYPSIRAEDGDKISYMGWSSFGRKWVRTHTYGGKIFENICQAFARDIMAHNMLAVEAAGYQIVLSVHDELLTEVPNTPDFSSEGLSHLLATSPSWARDIPLAAGGFESLRYRKD
jgi:DNA polymerase